MSLGVAVIEQLRLAGGSELGRRKRCPQALHERGATRRVERDGLRRGLARAVHVDPLQYASHRLDVGGRRDDHQRIRSFVLTHRRAGKERPQECRGTARAHDGERKHDGRGLRTVPRSRRAALDVVDTALEAVRRPERVEDRVERLRERHAVKLDGDVAGDVLPDGDARARLARHPHQHAAHRFVLRMQRDARSASTLRLRGRKHDRVRERCADRNTCSEAPEPPENWNVHLTPT